MSHVCHVCVTCVFTYRVVVVSVPLVVVSPLGSMRREMLSSRSREPGDRPLMAHPLLLPLYVALEMWDECMGKSGGWGCVGRRGGVENVHVCTIYEQINL